MCTVSLFYAAGFSPSVTVVVVDIVSAPGAGSVAHDRDGNLWKRAARYLGWLESYREKINVVRGTRNNLSNSSRSICKNIPMAHFRGSGNGIIATYLMPYTMGLYTALALAKREPQIVKSGLILVVSKIPE